MPVKLTCAQCGVDFSVDPYRVRNGTVRFCSRRCAGKGRPAVITAPIAERFWAKVDKSGECWIWTGAKHGRGKLHSYGSFRAVSRQRPVKTHRFVWELTYGPIPPGLLIMHSCDNPPCVNPAHLSLGTNAANVMDSSMKGRRHARRNIGSNNGLARLTESQVLEIRTRYATRRESFREVADDYGVTWGTIRYVVNGGGWKHVD